MSGRHPQNIGRLYPIYLLVYRFQYHFFPSHLSRLPDYGVLMVCHPMIIAQPLKADIYDCL